MIGVGGFMLMLVVFVFVLLMFVVDLLCVV